MLAVTPVLSRKYGESAKKEIAFAQTYFAMQTRKQEIIEQWIIEVVLASAREKFANSTPPPSWHYKPGQEN